MIRRKVALLATALLLAAPLAARAQEKQPLSPEQVEAVKKIVRDTIMENPAIIKDAIEALREMQRKEAEEDAKRTLTERKDEIFNDPADPVAGNPQGNVTLVEFFDYRCTYCKAVAETVLSTIKADGQVRLVFKEFPILGQDSVLAAKAALASRAQGKYLELHTAMMKMKGVVNEQSILKTAGEVGLDTDKLMKDMAAPEVEAAIRKNIELARDLDIGGTPAFVIGDRVIPGALDQPTLKTLIEQTRKTASKE